MSDPTNIAFINAGTTVPDAEAQGVMNALQIQMDRDFAPIWDKRVKLTFFPRGAVAPANMWWLSVLDNSDQAGALGYHDLTPTGQPLGKIFAHDDQRYGLAWSVTASHELMEMVVDPTCNLTVQDQNNNLYAYEVADACEDDQFSYVIGDYRVSDFVTPAWFEYWRAPSSAQFDFGKHIARPLQLLAGGYIGMWTATRGWTQVTAEMAPTMKNRAPVGCRRERRAVGQTRWMTSTVTAA